MRFACLGAAISIVGFLSSCHQGESSSRLKETYKSTNVSNWAYAGWAPRVASPDRIKMIISKQGLSLRVIATLGPEEVSWYIDDLIHRRQLLLDMQKNGIRFVEQTKLNAFLDEVSRLSAGETDGEALLFEKWGKYLQRSGDGDLVLTLVYPITISAEGIDADPKKVLNFVHAVDERRDFYGPQPESFIFGGFPALWFDGAIGLHGPIRYTSDPTANEDSGYLTEKNTEGKPSRWQLLRTHDSHGCIRMEGEHIMELRAILPSDHESLEQVPLFVKKFLDVEPYQGPMCPWAAGNPVIFGVKYYWYHPNQINALRAQGRRGKVYMPVTREGFYRAFFDNVAIGTSGDIALKQVPRWDVESDDGGVSYQYVKTGDVETLPVCEFENRKNYIVEFNPGEKMPEAMTELNQNMRESVKP